MRTPRRGAARRYRVFLVTLATLAAVTIPTGPGAEAQSPAPVACAATAADQPAATAAARRCHQPVEVLSARGTDTQLYANPDGSSTLTLAAEPQRVRRAGGWVPLDTTLTVAADGSVAPRAVLGDLRFSGGGRQPLISLGSGAGAFTLSWPAPLPKPVVAGDTATYPDVLAGVDLQVTATPTGFRHALVVRTPQAAADPALDEIRYALGGGADLSIDTRADGTLIAHDKGGRPVVWSQAASMWDDPASGGRSSVHGPGDGARLAAVTVRSDRATLSVRPDRGLLRGPGTRYPVYIDPPFSYVSGSSRWAYSNDHNGTNTDTSVARVGLDPSGGYLYRSFFEFPTSAGGYNLVGARIISAKVDATLYHSWSCGATPVTLWHSGAIMATPRTDWSPGLVTYLDTRSANAHKGTSDCGDQPNVNMSFSGNLAGDLQAAVNGGAGSYTVAFSARDSAGNGESTQDRWKKFLPSTVALSVQFNHAPGTPAIGQLSIDPSFTCSTSPVLINGRNGITLRATLGDADNDSITPQFTVNGVDPQYVHPMGPAVPGSFTASVDAAGLADGKAYSWTVRGGDGLDVGGTSPACPFQVDDSVPGDPGVTSTDLALSGNLIVPPAAAGAYVGRAGAVAVAPAAGYTTTAGYLYAVSTSGPAVPVVWVPARNDGTATLPVVPLDATRVNYLSVQSRSLTGQVGGIVTVRFNTHAATGTPHVRGDFTGDGHADPVLVAPADGGSALWRWTTTASGTSVLPPTAAGGVTGATSSAQFYPGDFDGDGRTDLATLSQPGAAPFSFSVALSDGNAVRGQAVDTSAWAVATVPGWAPPQLADAKAVIGDFTGDGRDDLGFAYNAIAGSRWDFWVAASTSTPGTVSFAAPVLFVINPTSDLSKIKVMAGDVNADGKADLMEAYDQGGCTTAFFLHLSAGGSMPNGTQKYASGANGLCWGSAGFLMGDFNGDGHADVGAFVDRSLCQSDLKTWLTVNGSDVAAPTTPFSGSGTQFWCQGNISPFVGDVNGDGRADIASPYVTSNKQVRLNLFLSNGTGFAAPSLWWEGGVGPTGTGSIVIDTTAKYQFYAGFSNLCLGIAGSSTASGTQFTEQSCSAGLNTQFTFERFGSGAYFHLHPAHNTGMCLTIGNNGNGANFTPLVQQACNNTVYHQMWQVNYVGGTGDIVVNVQSNGSGKCADVQSGGTAVGTGWIEYDCHGGDPQEYHLRRVG
ncbi:FG-GAP-like repeat-containing protein [Hamadaea tsunoensis]|uniref:FG-GAP-like repeat-containing protein n=1 Tax=Hamadaea tsunoensis TaxID=53368 RepID=UPI00041FF061|nr:RICIN domain-containing protein [Hamadaea tsunoensis]